MDLALKLDCLAKVAWARLRGTLKARERFQTGTHVVHQVGHGLAVYTSDFELLVFLSPSPKCWDDRYVLLHWL